MSKRTFRLRSFFGFFFCVVLLLGCGKPPATGGNSPVNEPGPNPDAVATLMLFGAPWCDNCKSEFPKIQALVAELPKDRAQRMGYLLYVTTGGTAQDQPTQEIADAYRAVLHLTAEAHPDEWRWKKFRQYVGGTLVLPGAAIVDAQGKVLHAYRAGTASFVPSEIVDDLKEALK